MRQPDIVIHRGDTLVYCAGALARRYEGLGGSVLYAGKPHAPIYDRALALVERIQGRPDRQRSRPCNWRRYEDGHPGAARAGLDALFVTGAFIGLCTQRRRRRGATRFELQHLYEESALWPVAVIPRFGRSRSPGRLAELAVSDDYFKTLRSACGRRLARRSRMKT